MKETLPAPTLTLEAVFQEKIFEATPLRQPHWMRDGRRFSYLDRAPDSEVETIWMYDIATGERTVVVAPEKLRLPKAERPAQSAAPEEDDTGEARGEEALRIHGYQWSPDETRILFARPPHRTSAPADQALYVYTLAARTLERVAHAETSLRNAKWSPDGRRLGYLRGDDLYVLDLATGKEVRLTDTARPAVYNGRFGWVYEEELELLDGWAWSPDGRRIAYFQVDETPVPLVFLPNFDDLHMKPVLQRYPKAGDPNPIVRIGVVEVPASPPEAGGVPPTRWVDLGPDTDIYISRMQWTPQGDLLLHRMPRLQNRIELLKADVATGRTALLLAEEDKAWVDARRDLTFIKGTDQFIWPSDRSGYNHLYLYDLSGQLLRQLTQGDWDVDAVAGVDATHRLLYFTAARPSPLERQLFRVLLDGGGGIMQVTEASGTHQPLFAPDAVHYLDTHSSRAVPPHTRLYRASGVHVADVHASPMPRLREHPLGTWEFTTFTTGDGLTLNAALLRPPDFDPGKRYPVLMHTYGGPGSMQTYAGFSSQVVMDEYGNGGGWHQLLAQRGYLILLMDGRGTGARGRDFVKVIYANLGHWEVHDLIEGARWMARQSFVDARRIGIWGWSYGGYLAALSLLRGANVFKTAIAVAPVTHWQFYDTIYTERYMRRPQDNPKGYAESAPLTHAEKLTGNLLLVQGTADDNVHFQNSARLAAELQKHNKPFRAMFYPGKHHGLEGVAPHLYALLTDYILENL
ncbi:MAG TPA: S9 family peptidase [Chthonomonadaceae bacterium]|nr:S9 family peptidase [Chthonomonadaceae bacterium]